MSSVSNPETFSSNWHVLLGIFTETSFTVSGIALLINDSTAAAEQEAGMHIPNEMAVPLSGLDWWNESVWKFNFSNKTDVLKTRKWNTYVGTAIRGLTEGFSSDCTTSGTGTLWKSFWYAFCCIIPFKSIIKLPKQYCVLYCSAFRLIWKHSAKPPNSYRFPSNIDDGNLPHASKTEMNIFKIRKTECIKIVFSPNSIYVSWPTDPNW